jgi:hypothetical protein
MAGCRGDGVQYGHCTNGSNFSVGGWGCPYGSPNNNNARTGALSYSIVRWNSGTCTSVYVK